MISAIKIHRKSLMNWRILIKSIIAQVIMMSIFINMVLSVEHHEDFGKVKDGLTLFTLMYGFSSILDTG